eukprot:12467069-Alexandrium_andersonii.AAC.1
MSASLVGSEMCIRDRLRPAPRHRGRARSAAPLPHGRGLRRTCVERRAPCLLYTSDAADDM